MSKDKIQVATEMPGLNPSQEAVEAFSKWLATMDAFVVPLVRWGPQHTEIAAAFAEWYKKQD